MHHVPTGNQQGPYKTLSDAVNVHDADVHQVPVNELFHRHTGIQTTLLAGTLVGATGLIVTSAVGFSIGDDLQIQNGVIETTHPRITGILGLQITLDRPLDYAFSIGDSVEVVDTNMAVVGTLAAPVSFKFSPNDVERWHVVSFIIGMVLISAADDSTFGDIAPLLNGCVLRGYNATADQYSTFTNWKTNSDIKMDMYDVPYTDKAGPGLFGLNGNGQIKLRTGATPQLDGTAGDFLELLIQDDLTGLVRYQLKAQGHIEGV